MTDQASPTQGLRGLWGSSRFTDDGADIALGEGVVLELTRDAEHGWAVWGVRIDGQLYRGRTGLQAEPLEDGPFKQRVEIMDSEKRVTDTV